LGGGANNARPHICSQCCPRRHFVRSD
jgi:hypothetical protein